MRATHRIASATSRSIGIFARSEPLEPRLLLAGYTPTDDEQYMLELINRGRANPAAEAARYGIDLNEGLAPGTISTAAKQPIAFNPVLIQSARDHSQWMIDNDVFAHAGVNGSDPGQRMTNAGYVFKGTWGWGENLAMRGTTAAITDPTPYVADEHQDLFVDTGIDGRGHRLNLMNAYFREVGVGVITGPFTADKVYNTVMSTQDFAYSNNAYFLTGVAYQDGLVTNDDFYTPGEGIDAVTVKATRVSDNAVYQTQTWSSGGYSLALPAGTYNVVATSSTWGTLYSGSLTMGSLNVKRDFILDGAAFTGGSGADTWLIRRDSAGANVQVFVNGAGTPSFQTPVSSMGALVINGAGGNDVLTIDCTWGNPIRSDQLIFDGGAGANTLALTGGTLAINAGTLPNSKNLSLSLTSATAQVNTDLSLGAVSFAGAGTGSRLVLNAPTSASQMLRVYPAGIAGAKPTAAQIQPIWAQVRTGYNAGAWNGAGIGASTIAHPALNGLGLVTGTDAQGAQYVGVREMILGDVNGDDKVTIGDVMVALNSSNYQQDGSWLNGDVNYDGKATIGDVMLMMNTDHYQQVYQPSNAPMVAVASGPLDLAETAMAPLASADDVPVSTASSILATSSTQSRPRPSASALAKKKRRAARFGAVRIRSSLRVPLDPGQAILPARIVFAPAGL